ncbi:hypothetical protein LOTGIDRAFT_230171 [Lottia gigantea]|uniref:Fibropellin-1 n=1 Tax=Lottia gigantea TaxID=225164 RepID=V4BCH6_LOTGI|nr:hypothetical protein LOTGIDRAFT_230171 [Lottia gigantea]ESP03827.1 hypothetical protein LOTGIDRAFT_230171 [Lottia gigantea]
MESITANGWWANYEPKIQNGECVAVERDGDRFKWAFGSCQEKNTFVCRRKVCSEGSFHCSNERCIKYDLTCDGEDDCGDMSDELNCSNQCGNVLQKESGEIMSDNFPSPYPMNKNCFWLIEVPVTYNAHLKFSNFITEEGLDKVQVFVGGMTESTSKLVATLSGDMTSKLPEFTSPNNFILVKFSSDASTAAAGFKAMFSAKKEMFPLMKMLTATSSYQTLTAPSYPNNYLGNQDYTWIIAAEQRTSIVTLQIEEVDLKDDDVVVVRDGEDVTSEELLKLTSSNEITSPFIFSSKPKLYITLQTRGYNTGKGFKLQYKQGCSIEFVASQGMILSPGFNAGQYPNYANCDWLIKEKEGKPMTLSFISFDIQTSGDSLKVYNGTSSSSELIGDYKGNYIGASLPSILADTGTLFLTFTSDSTGSKKGFHLEFSVDCPAPNFNSFTKTMPASPSNSPGSEFEVECVTGYHLAAEEFQDPLVTDKFQARQKITMKCSRGGKWNTLRMPTCEPKYCGIAPELPNGYTVSSTGVTFGMSVTYNCISGYSFKETAKTSVECLVSGQWGDMPVCEATQCITPTLAPNSHLTKTEKSTPYGAGVFFSCDPGYDLIGAPKSYCGPNGQYTAPVPTCKAIVCVVPPIMNGAVDNKDPAEFQISRTFTCNQGYTLSGTGSVSCGADGNFVGLPSCSDVNECNTANGGCNQQCENMEGSFKCSCNDGYILNANKKTCDDIKECDENKGGCSDMCLEMKPGYKCECNPGRELFTQDGVSSYSVMSPESGLREGDVLRYNHTCVNKQCPTPVMTPNLILLTKMSVFRFQDEIEFACPIGYMLQGSSKLTCQVGATWSAAEPTCKAITCAATVSNDLKNEPAFNPENKTVGYMEMLAMTCTYADGSTKMKKQYCLYNQTTDSYNLEGDDYECGTIDCGKPPNIPGAVYEGYTDGGNTSYGATYAFKCDTLYTIVTSIANPDDRVINCGVDRKWDAKDMRCEGITCVDPGRPLNGYQNATSYEEGELVMFGCSLDGYTLDSIYPITCIKDGTGNGLEWNSTVPKCLDTQKPKITGCQELEVDLYSSADVINIPNFSDNGGLKLMKVTPFYPAADIILSSKDKLLTFEFEDNAGNKDSCNTKISIKDTVPPTLTCPESYSISIEMETDTTIDNFSNNPAIATDDSGDVTITYNPPTVTADVGHLNIAQPVNVEASDKFGNKATCTFQVVTSAAPCSPLSFPVAAHTTKTCSNITNGYQCNLTCETNYLFLDSSNAQVFSCIDNNPWDQAAIDVAGGCSRADVDAKYTVELVYEYKKEDGSAIQDGCEESYKESIQRTMAKVSSDLQKKCVDTYDNPATVSSDVKSVTISGSSVFASFVIQINGNQASSCGNFFTLDLENPTFFINGFYKGPYSGSVCSVINVVVNNNKVSVTNPFTEFSCDRTRKLANFKCLLCSEGYENMNLTSGLIDCQPCARGKFTVDGNRQVCEMCSIGTTTYLTGRYSNADCKGKCSDGSVSATGLAPCIECPRNTYFVNESYCEPCPGNGITRQSASTNLTDCKDDNSEYDFKNVVNQRLPDFLLRTLISCILKYTIQSNTRKVTIAVKATDTTSSTGSTKASDCTDAQICQGPNPCQNGGSCISSQHTFKCDCPTGYYGKVCDKVFNPCSSNPCYNGGVCTQTGSTTTYTCSCPQGTSGQNCETDLPNCDPYPCGTNGMCQDYIDSYFCHCKSGYKGQNCSETSDVCLEKPCSSPGTDGVCVKQGTARRKCNCLPGYSGDDCSENIDECASTPCLNRGKCNDLVAEYNCECNEGYNGDQCTMRDSLCKGVTCTNGMCIEDHMQNTYLCLCDKGYMYNSTTKTCDMIDNCESDPCVSDNTVTDGCSSSIEGFKCTCKSGYTGSKCQHNIDDCASMPCGKNSVMCTDLLNGFNCTCKEGYEGDTCQRLKDTCSGSPCKGEGVKKCKLVPNDYICECIPGYTGKNCETNIDDCASRPCMHGSNCTDKVNGFSCDCEAGWMGDMCEEEVDSCKSNQCVNGAECQNLFNDYYCDCKDNTYDRNCSQKENLCQSANPCIHDQPCTETNGLKCMCSSEWKGIGCEIAVDYCAEDVCLHGGKCTPSLFNYTCECFNGYQGRNCDENPDNCAGVTCPGGATCVDGEDQYFCRCPLGKVGKDCDKDLDTDYMLLFNSPMKDGMAAFPYPISFKSNQFSITFWVRFWDIDDTGNFLSIFFTESQASTKVTSKLLNIDHEGLKIMNGTEEKSYTSKYISKHNDGKWHNIAVTWNGETGVLKYVVDSLSDGPIADFSTGITVDSNVWVVLGVKYDYQMKKPIMNQGFRGWISQVNLYSSVVDFETEIPQLLKTPQKVFNDSNPVQLWSDYELMRNVQRVPQSTIQHPKDSCPRGFSNPNACDRKDPGRTQVKVEKCPDNIVMMGEKRITQATWTPPEFPDSDTVISNYAPDSQFLWGMYPIVYQASSNAGHKALCTFYLFIQYDACSKPEDPTNGKQIYLPSAGKFHAASEVGCNDDFEFSQPTPALYTCGLIGSWDPPRMYNTFVLPPCGAKKTPPKVQVKLTVKYKIKTNDCPQVKDSLIALIRERFVAVSKKHGNKICGTADCSDIGVVIECIATRRRKRQTGDVTVVISVPLVPSVLNPEGGGTITPEELINQLLLGGGGELDFQNQIPGATPITNAVTIVSTPACPEGQTVISEQCVECAAGTFYDVSSKMCKSCPINKYQNMAGQKECMSCTAGLTTENMGSEKVSDCKDDCPLGEELTGAGQCQKCPVGKYRSADDTSCQPCDAGTTTAGEGTTSKKDCNLGDCQKGYKRTSGTNCEICPVGSYQDKVHQTECISCGGSSYRTDQEGSKSKTDCKFFCPDGEEQLDKNATVCTKCGIGFHRNSSVYPYQICQPCPGNFKTPKEGAVSDTECTIFKCPAGKYPVMDKCEPCPLGEFQPEAEKEKCIKCTGDLSTRNKGSTNESQCEIFCPDGEEQLDKNATVCTKCGIGFHRNSSVYPYQICQPCPGNFKTPKEGAVSDTECTIYKCPAGKYPVMDKCEPCPLGEFQPEAEKEKCIKCTGDLSTRNKGSTNESQCENYCVSGEEKNANGTCDTCQRGYYKDNKEGLFGECNLCPIEFITLGTGAKQASDCNVKNCSAGSKLESNQCIDCPVGFYQEEKWQTTCMKCDAEKTTENKGADRKELCILKCNPGKEDVNGTCTDCQVGFYKSTQAAEKCKMCPTGFITIATGSTSDTDCKVAACTPGEYRDDALNSCKKCTYGDYQPMKWQTECLSCGAGNTTYVKGADDISQCQADCLVGQENINNTCSPCEIGFYRDKVDKEQPRCLKCPGNKITAETGATKAEDCTVTACVTLGEYLVEATNQCQKCPKGQYQNEERQKSCKNCPTGKTTENEGSSKPNDCKTDCLAGSQYNEGAGKCELCPVGQYRDKTTWGCQMCPDQLSTTQTGAVSQSECTKSPCKAGEKFDQTQKKCVACPLNTYQPDANKFECISCTRGESTSSTGSTAASDCQKKCSDATKIDCHSNAVCTNVATDKGYTCTCTDDYQGDGVNCTNKCLLGYCGNFGTCVPDSSPIQCQCRENYEGAQCQSRKDPSVSGPLANKTIIIGVVTAVALLLFIILIIVCIIVRARRRHQKRKPFLNEFDDRSVGTRMSFQNYDPYGSKPPSMGGQRLMLPSNVEKMYDNPVFREDDPAVYRA